MRTFSPRFPSRVQLGLLATTCVLPLAPQALAAEAVSSVPPRPSVAAAPPSLDLVARWHVPPTSPWAPYEKATLVGALAAGVPLTFPDVRRLEVVEAAIDAATSAASVGLPSDTMWLVDLRGAASLAFAATLSQRASDPVVPILTFNNWPAENETIPAEETLAGMMAWQPAATSGAMDARPVFVLDAWRLAFPEEPVPDEVTDNRYMLGPSDLPDAATLLRHGIRRVVYVVESREEFTYEEDDLNAVFLDYEAAGIEIALVDLEDLVSWPQDDPRRSRGILSVEAWSGCFRRRAYHPVERPTMVSDPLFYARSRGGFAVLGTAWSAHAAMAGHGGG